MGIQWVYNAQTIHSQFVFNFVPYYLVTVCKFWSLLLVPVTLILCKTTCLKHTGPMGDSLHASTVYGLDREHENLG